MNEKEKDLMGKYNPFKDVDAMGRFQGLFDRLTDVYSAVDRMWDGSDLTGDAFYALQSNKSTLPKINVAELDDSFEVDIAVSGFNKDDLALEFKDSCLYIKVDKTEDLNSKTKKWLKREISSRSSRRVIQFPVKIDSTNITCAFDEDKSVVTCTLPKVTVTEPETVKIKID